MAVDKKALSEKIKKIMHEGVRKNTHAPVSKKNPRKKVDIKQAIAVASAMARQNKK